MNAVRLFVAVAIDELAQLSTLIEPVLNKVADRIHP